jgi:hypothetical protein
MINSQNTHFITEKQEKIKYIEKMRTQKTLLKSKKIKLLPEIENNLLNDDSIHLKTLLTLCILENINLMYLDKNKYFEIINNIDEKSKMLIIHKKYYQTTTYANNQKYYDKYGFEINVSNDIIENYKSKYYKVDTIHFKDSLKSISSYKLDELIEMCNIFGIEYNKNTDNDNTKKIKITKKYLYDLILENY